MALPLSLPASLPCFRNHLLVIARVVAIPVAMFCRHRHRHRRSRRHDGCHVSRGVSKAYVLDLDNTYISIYHIYIHIFVLAMSMPWDLCLSRWCRRDAHGEAEGTAARDFQSGAEDWSISTGMGYVMGFTIYHGDFLGFGGDLLVI